jgi:hypothetical protein
MTSRQSISSAYTQALVFRSIRHVISSRTFLTGSIIHVRSTKVRLNSPIHYSCWRIDSSRSCAVPSSVMISIRMVNKANGRLLQSSVRAVLASHRLQTASIEVYGFNWRRQTVELRRYCMG